MTFNQRKDLKNILHPYIFILIENDGIQNNLLDYSLCMMRVGANECLRSKENKNKIPFILINDLDVL